MTHTTHTDQPCNRCNAKTGMMCHVGCNHAAECELPRNHDGECGSVADTDLDNTREQLENVK